MVVAAHVEQLIRVIGGILSSADRDFAQSPVQGGEHVDGFAGGSQVELVPVVERDGRDVVERMGENRLEGDIPVDHPGGIQGAGRDAADLVIAEVSRMAGAFPRAENQRQLSEPETC